MMTADPIPSLRDMRLSRGLDRETIAGHLHSTVAQVEAIEAGKAAPSDVEKRALCAVFGIDADELDRAITATKIARKRPQRRGGRLEIVEIA